MNFAELLSHLHLLLEFALLVEKSMVLLQDRVVEIGNLRFSILDGLLTGVAVPLAAGSPLDHVRDHDLAFLTESLGITKHVLMLMLSFGASFGYTVMGRISLAIGRAQEMLGDNRNAFEAAQIHPRIATGASLVLIIAVLAVWKVRGGGSQPDA